MRASGVSMHFGAALCCGLLLAASTVWGQYPRPAARGQVVSRATRAYPQASFPTRPFPTRDPYRAQAPPERRQYHSAPRPADDHQYADYQTEERQYPDEQPIERVQYQSRRPYVQEVIVDDARPVGSTSMEPVEVIESHAPVMSYAPGNTYGSSSSCGECSTCADGCGSDGGICDPVSRSKGCNREKCPCPSEEALSYYRCNFYGHYPTFWRSWPADFQRYRPQLTAETVYDRYRKPSPAEQRGGAGAPRDPDLDKQLQDLLREQQGPEAGPGPADGKRQAPGAAPRRNEPELLPEDALREQAPPKDPTPEIPSIPDQKDQSYYELEQGPVIHRTTHRTEQRAMATVRTNVR